MTTLIVNDVEQEISDLDVVAVNVADRQVMLEDGQVLDMASLHEADGDEVEDDEFAVFATVQLPDGKWIAVHFADYHKSRN